MLLKILPKPQSAPDELDDTIRILQAIWPK